MHTKKIYVKLTFDS